MRALQCLTLVAVVLVATALVGGPAFAGDYHTGGQLICADCHTMHYSLSHGYPTSTPGVFTDTTLGTGPNARLLKAPVNTLCTTCHDGQASAPDVVGNNTPLSSYTRQAGGLNWATGAGTNDTGYDTYMGHSLGSTAVAPGGTWSDSTGLHCTNCHGAHNRAAGDPSNTNVDINSHTMVNAWRNVSRRAGGSSTGSNVISYETGTNSGAYDIFEADPTLGQISTHYDIANESLNEPLQTDSGVSEWCKKCHTNFHSTLSTGSNYVSPDWFRHPTGGVDMYRVVGTNTNDEYTQYLTHTNKVPLMSADPAAPDNTSTPTCTTCHKAHGNKNAFGLIEMSGTGTVNEEGDTGGTGMRDLCKQCHTQGG